MLHEISVSLAEISRAVKREVKTVIAIVGITIAGFLLTACKDEAQSTPTTAPIILPKPSETPIPQTPKATSTIIVKLTETATRITKPTMTVVVAQVSTPQPIETPTSIPTGTIIATTENTASPEKEVNEIVDYNMVFMAIPLNEQMANEQSDRFIEKVNIFKGDNKGGIFIFETNTEIDWMEILNGKHDKYIQSMFQKISAKLGKEKFDAIFVPYPESNEPIWNNAKLNPGQISELTNKFAKMLKATLPNFRTGTMLNMKTYADHDWSNGEFVDLIEYITGIDTTLNILPGIQSFSWIDRDTGERLIDPNIYLNPKLILKAVKDSGSKGLWINTGIPNAVELNSGKIVKLTFEERYSIFKQSLEIFKFLKANGVEDLTINLFTENKLDGPNDNSEKINWSFTDKELKKLLNDLDNAGFKVSLFQ